MAHPITFSDVLKEPVQARFRSNVHLSEWGCLEWRGAAPGRYGSCPVNGRNVPAHRVAWVMRHGCDIPDDLVIDHLCCNKRCVNADHLEAVSDAENVRRVHRPPRGWKPVPAPILTAMEYRGRRWCDVQWITAQNGKVEKHIKMFDDPEHAAAFAAHLSKTKPGSTVVEECPRDIRDRLLRAYNDIGVSGWLREPHRDLGGERPIDLIRTGRVAEVRAVTEWLLSVNLGGS